VIVVVRGPPAVGTTTVARLLRDREAPIDETGVHAVCHEFDEENGSGGSGRSGTGPGGTT
jgi:broad-specificity NMP kinase